MVVLEHEGKSSEEQIQYSQEDSRQNTEVEALQQSASVSLGRFSSPTIGSKNNNWNGRMQDAAIVLGIDLDIFSIGAIHSWLPVSLRSLMALFLCMTSSADETELRNTMQGAYKKNRMVSLWDKGDDERELESRPR